MTRTSAAPASGATVAYADNGTMAYPDDAAAAASASEFAPPTLAAGEVLALGERYTVVSTLSGAGETGEGAVYLVRNDAGEMLAAKFYQRFSDPRAEPNEEALGRIHGLSSANVVPLREWGTGARRFRDRYSYEICDYASGGTLATAKGLTPQEIERVVVPQVHAALTALHRVGVIHGDLKPHNLFFVDETRRRLVLGDFGAAKTGDHGGEDLRYSTVLKRSQFYCAPECFRGLVSPKGDYYALGMCLIHLLYPQQTDRDGQARILERQEMRAPVLDFDEKFGRLNDLIAGLTLRDVARRWGPHEVSEWLAGRAPPLQYSLPERPLTPERNVLLRTWPELFAWIDRTPGWFDLLINDEDSFQDLRKWVDPERDAVFRQRIRSVQQDGEQFVYEALVRGQLPLAPIRFGDVSIDLARTADFQADLRRTVGLIDDCTVAGDLDQARVLLFSLECLLSRTRVRLR